MKTEVLYFIDMKVPLNIKMSTLAEYCQMKNITQDRLEHVRCWRFYAKKEEDLRWLMVSLLLIPIKEEIKLK